VERLQDERIRALAELENVRKRAEKQVLDERQYGAAKFARDMLSVADNLRRAIDAAANHRGEPGVDALLTGVETRTSSPVRLTRGEDGQSLNTRGLFPAGEGAGYAGGILSAGVDGIRVGEALTRQMLNDRSALAACVR